METIIHLRRDEPRKMKNMLPAHVWALAQPYGLQPHPSECTDGDADAAGHPGDSTR